MKSKSKIKRKIWNKSKKKGKEQEQEQEQEIEKEKRKEKKGVIEDEDDKIIENEQLYEYKNDSVSDKGWKIGAQKGYFIYFSGKKYK